MACLGPFCFYKNECESLKFGSKLLRNRRLAENKKLGSPSIGLCESFTIRSRVGECQHVLRNNASINEVCSVDEKRVDSRG